MGQRIIRLFDSRERAEAAADALRTGRFVQFSEVQVFADAGPTSPAVGTADPRSADARRAIAPDAGAATADTDAIVSALQRLPLRAVSAQALAPRIRQGAALVAVDAPFGTARQAIEMLGAHGPIDAGVPVEDDRTERSEPAAPLSRYFGWPLLIDDPAPLSRRLGLPLLSRRGRTTSQAAGLPEIVDAPARAGAARNRGWRDDPAPLSTLLGLPLLAREPAPLSSRLGLRLLAREPAPLSRAIGLPLLAGGPAPLSASIGLPLLVRRGSGFLSSLFGIPLLTRRPWLASEALGLPLLSRRRDEDRDDDRDPAERPAGRDIDYRGGRTEAGR